MCSLNPIFRWWDRARETKQSALLSPSRIEIARHCWDRTVRATWAADPLPGRTVQ